MVRPIVQALRAVARAVVSPRRPPALPWRVATPLRTFLRAARAPAFLRSQAVGASHSQQSPLPVQHHQYFADYTRQSQQNAAAQAEVVYKGAFAHPFSFRHYFSPGLALSHILPRQVWANYVLLASRAPEGRPHSHLQESSAGTILHVPLNPDLMLLLEGITEHNAEDCSSWEHLKSISEDRYRARRRLASVETLLDRLGAVISLESAFVKEADSLHIQFKGLDAQSTRRLLASMGWTGNWFTLSPL
jgi:hypothetical protein